MSERFRLTTSLPGVLRGVDASFEGVILSTCKIIEGIKEDEFTVSSEIKKLDYDE